MAEPAKPAPIPIRSATSVQTLALLSGAEDLPPELGLALASILRRLDDLEARNG